MSLFKPNTEVARLEATIDSLREALADGWHRRSELEAEVEALRTEVAELQAAKAHAPAALTADRETLRRQIDDLLALKARVVDQLGAVGGQLASSLGRLTSAGDGATAPSKGTGRVFGDIAAIGRTYSGLVRIEAEPLSDFGSIAALERALAGVEGGAEARVRRLEGDRAVLELELAEPVEVLRALDGTLPFNVDVADAGPDHIVLAPRNGAA